MNQVILVGRLVADPETKELESGKNVSNIVIAVTRNYKNQNGEYETDFIDCELWDVIAERTVEYCKKGDVLGIKGSIKTSYYDKDDTKIKRTSIVAEKVTFLSSKKED